MKKALLVVCMSIFFVSEFTFAQAGRDYLELLRSESQTDKRAVITTMMQFSEKESDAFWPIYRDYENAKAKIGDERIRLIEDFATHYKQMSNEKAKDLMDNAFMLEEKRRKLRMDYVRKMEKALSPIVAARFLQVENQLQLLKEVQIATRLPLISEPNMKKQAG